MAIGLLSACEENQGTSLYAPGLNTRAEAVDGMIVGNRLMAAQEYELALEAFQRAAAKDGLTGETLLAIGTANLRLDRLNQAETTLRRASTLEPTWPEIWNNLGVVLMERDKTAEASEVFRKAYALDNGESDSIRENLRLALEKLNERVYDDAISHNYKLVRRSDSDYLVEQFP